MPPVKAILAQELVPSLAAHMLAHEAYDGQMTDEPREEGRPDNLFEPVPGNYGARGRFSDQASPRAPAIWASEHRDALIIAGGVLVLGLAAATVMRMLGEDPSPGRRTPVAKGVAP
jgi:hypothetical protein